MHGYYLSLFLSVTNLDPMNRGLKPELLKVTFTPFLLVTNLDPMNRGLKLASRAIDEIVLVGQVTNLDPMNRGLKPGSSNPKPVSPSGYKPRPDE